MEVDDGLDDVRENLRGHVETILEAGERAQAITRECEEAFAEAQRTYDRRTANSARKFEVGEITRHQHDLAMTFHEGCLREKERRAVARRDARLMAEI